MIEFVMNQFELLLPAISFISILFSIIMTVKSAGNISVNRILAILFIAVAIQSLMHYLYLSDNIFKQAFLIEIDIPLLYLFPPLFYFVIRSIMNIRLKLSFRDIMHIIPFLVIIAFLIPFYFSTSQDKIEWLERFAGSVNPVRSLYYGIYYTQLFIYVYIILRLLKKTTNKTVEVEGIDNKMSQWFKYLSYLTIFYLFIVFIPFFVRDEIITMLLIPVLSFVFFTILFYANITFQDQLNQIKFVSAIIEDDEKYGNQKLSEQDMADIMNTTHEYLVKNYKKINQELTIIGLAEELRIPLCHLSEAFNKRQKQSFQSYISKYL